MSSHYIETRLDSSRMHTVHLLTVSPSMRCTGGGAGPGVPWSWGVPGLGGVCSRGVSGPGVPGPWAGSALGGFCLGGGVCSGGCLVLGGSIPACTEANPPCEQNSWHTLLKILPCPKLRLRAVISLQRSSIVLAERGYDFLISTTI